jgi:hypothetical protein
MVKTMDDFLPNKSCATFEGRKTRLSEDHIGPADTSLDLFQKVYRNPSLPLAVRMRAAIAAKDHEHPKLGISVNVNAGEDFAARLDAAIARSQGLRVIEHVGEGSMTKANGEGTSEAAQVSQEHQRKPPLFGSIKRRV